MMRATEAPRLKPWRFQRLWLDFCDQTHRRPISYVAVQRSPLEPRAVWFLADTTPGILAEFATYAALMEAPVRVRVIGGWVAEGRFPGLADWIGFEVLPVRSSKSLSSRREDEVATARTKWKRARTESAALAEDGLFAPTEQPVVLSFAPAGSAW